MGEYKTKLTGMPRRAEVLFELLEDTDVDLSFAAHNTYESNTFKEIARHVLCRLGEVVLDLHQFSSVEEKEASFSGRLKKCQQFKISMAGNWKERPYLVWLP